MAEHEWASLLDTLNEVWNKLAVQIEDFAKALTDMFRVIDNMEKSIYKAPRRKRPRPPKKINCNYSVERQVQRNLPYQRRIF